MKEKTIQKAISTTLTTPAYSKETGGSVKLDLHDGSCNNYLDSGLIARFFRWQHYQPVVHWVTTAVFILIIYSGLTNGNPSINFETLNGLLIIILVSGFIFSLWLGFQLTADNSKSTWKQNGLFPMILVMGVYAVAGMWILPLPVLT